MKKKRNLFALMLVCVFCLSGVSAMGASTANINASGVSASVTAYADIMKSTLGSIYCGRGELMGSDWQKIDAQVSMGLDASTTGLMNKQVLNKNAKAREKNNRNILSVSSAKKITVTIIYGSTTKQCVDIL